MEEEKAAVADVWEDCGKIALADSEDERDKHIAAASSASLFFSVSVFETTIGMPNLRRIKVVT